MKILIIGSKGFIGSHALHYFSQAHSVFGADIVNDYNTPNYFQVDATNADFASIFSNHQYDVCINCSGAASVPLSFENPLRDYELNTHNVFKILYAIKQHQPNCKFINLSSAAVYGNPQYQPIDEKHPVNPISPYGRHKLYAEQICREFYELYDIATISLRIFSAYGPGLKKQFFWDLHKKATLHNTVELWGTGNESRDYIFIDDLVHGIETVMNKALFDGTAINVANSCEVKIKNAASIFFQNYPKQKQFTFKGNIREGDPTNWKAETSKLKALGYRSKVSITQGLKQYILWLQDDVE